MVRYYLIALFIGLPFFGSSQTITEIYFNGAVKTDTLYLRNLIDSKIGNTFDSLTAERDVQTLKNLNLFFSVIGKFNQTASGNYNITFLIEEAVYLYPIFSISGFDDQLKIQAGANQINFLGKAQSIGFLYQYYDRHSLSFFYTAPRHANNKTGHEFALAKYSTVEPLYFEDTVSSFNFDNYSVSLGGFYWLNRFWQIGAGGMYMWERYEQIDDALELPQKSFNFNKYQARGSITYAGINQHYEFREGIYFKLFAETIQTPSQENASFLKTTTTLKYFKRVGKKGNFGIQNKLGIATNNAGPFSPFVLDGFINVRGVGNRVARGTAEIVINAEYRHTLLSKKFFFLQIAGFTDYGTLRYAGGEFNTLFTRPDINIFVGAGLRLHSRYIYNTIFRLDYSVNPTNPSARGFTFGLGQFF